MTKDGAPCKRHKCPMCDYSSDKVGNIKQHMNEHYRETVKFPICAQVLSKKIQLEQTHEKNTSVRKNAGKNYQTKLIKINTEKFVYQQRNRFYKTKV